MSSGFIHIVARVRISSLKTEKFHRMDVYTTFCVSILPLMENICFKGKNILMVTVVHEAWRYEGSRLGGRDPAT